MDKKNVGKYVLVFEPKYSYNQFAVHFDGDKTKVTAIKKYTDLPLDGRKSVVKKNTLGDIDRILTPLEDEYEFFKKYVDPSIFRYSYNNLHKMFIAYKQNQKIYTLNCEFNNQKLNNKLDLVSGSKISDLEGIYELIEFATDTSENNRFLSFAENSRQEKKTSVSSQTLTLLTKMRVFNKMSQTYQYTNSEMIDEKRYLERLLTEHLTSYKEYRELFLLRSAYADAMEQERIKLENMKQKLSTQKNNKPIANDTPCYTQINLLDAGYQKIK